MNYNVKLKGTLRATEKKSTFIGMPVKQTIPYAAGIFAITFTRSNWLPLVGKTDDYKMVCNSR
jgi:hypothetical protein